MRLSVLLAVVLIVGFSEAKEVVRIIEDAFPLSIIHVNDFHARFEEMSLSSLTCSDGEEEEYIGGYARMVAMVKQLREELADTNPIYLNAGDNFQGTLWYSLGRWNVTAYFLNMLKADAMTIGNHEFDHNIEGVLPFIDAIESPILVTNIDSTDEPTWHGTLNSTVIERGGRKIGIIGVILSTTNEIASTRKLKFLDEALTVREEAERLKDQGVDIIVVLSHCGLDVDYVIARDGGPHIDVIVGGHSHTFMYTGDNPPGPDYPQDEYPAIVQSDSGQTVLIVQASAYTKYVGNITVFFDEAGKVVAWEGEPIFLGSEVIPDPEILEELVPWKEEYDSLTLRKVGEARVQLQKSGCNYKECNLGSFVTDSFVNHFVDKAEDDDWTYAAISATNVGGVRTTLCKGDLSYGALVEVLPFENTLDVVTLSGKYLLEMLEFGVTNSYDADRFNGVAMLQVSGLKIAYNTTNPIGSRVVSAKVRCQKCRIPEYFPLDLEANYRVILPSFLAAGGDGFTMISNNAILHEQFEIDVDALEAYVEKMSPIYLGDTERITMYT